MCLFGLNNRSRRSEGAERTQDHPAFLLGKLMADHLVQLEYRLANKLNQAQHRIGFGARNTLLIMLGVFFLLYFIALLTQ
ncbi:hypothetical protein GCM10027578_05230 [Spirosoma luteolum]